MKTDIQHYTDTIYSLFLFIALPGFMQPGMLRY